VIVLRKLFTKVHAKRVRSKKAARRQARCQALPWCIVASSVTQSTTLRWAAVDPLLLVHLYEKMGAKSEEDRTRCRRAY